MNKGVIATADNLGFIRLVTPLADEEYFYQRVHSVTKNGNPITFFTRSGSKFLTGYQNGNFEVFVFENKFLQQELTFECRVHMHDHQFPVHADYFDKLHDYNKFSLVYAFVSSGRYYLINRCAEVFVVSLQGQFERKFYLPFAPGKFLTFSHVHLGVFEGILEAGYRTKPTIFDLNGHELCQLQQPKIEYLTALSKRFEVVTALQAGTQLFVGDAQGYVCRYELEDLVNQRFVGQRTRTGFDHGVRCLQLLSFYQVTKYMITAMCAVDERIISVSDVQEKQIASAIRREKSYTQISQIKRGTNPVQPVTEQTLVRHKQQTLAFGDATGQLTIAEASSGLIMWYSHRHQLGCINTVCQSGEYMCAAAMDKNLIVLHRTDFINTIYIVGDVCAICEVIPLVAAESSDHAALYEEEQWEAEEEVPEEVPEEVHEVQRIDLGFFNDL